MEKKNKTEKRSINYIKEAICLIKTDEKHFLNEKKNATSNRTIVPFSVTDDLILF